MVYIYGHKKHVRNCFSFWTTGKIEECSLEELGLENESEKPSNALLGRAWSPGWRNADKALREFVDSIAFLIIINLIFQYRCIGYMVKSSLQVQFKLDLKKNHNLSRLK